MSKEVEKIISQAHTRICRRKGLEYAPTTEEISIEINNHKMRNQIKEALAEYLTKNGVDGYGQTKVIEPCDVFKDKTEEVLKWNEEHKLLPIKTYGGRFGIYKGFNVAYINDAEIKKACYDAVKNNEVYRRAMTSW